MKQSDGGKVSPLFKKNINAGGRLEIYFFTSLPTPFRFLFENFKFKKTEKEVRKTLKDPFYFLRLFKILND